MHGAHVHKDAHVHVYVHTCTRTENTLTGSEAYVRQLSQVLSYIGFAMAGGSLVGRFGAVSQGIGRAVCGLDVGEGLMPRPFSSLMLEARRLWITGFSVRLRDVLGANGYAPA